MQSYSKLVILVKPFINIANHYYTIENMDHKAQRGNNKGVIRMTHNLKVEDFKRGTPTPVLSAPGSA